MIIINIIFLIILILTFLYVINYKKHLVNVNYENIQKNESLEKEKEKLLKKTSQSQAKLDHLIQEINKLTNNQTEELNKLYSIQEQVKQTQASAEEIARKGFERYCDTLEQAYQEADAEYDKITETLALNYGATQAEYQKKLDEAKTELDKVQATRKAAIEAALREEEIKKKRDFYCLSPKQSDLKDIQILEEIKPQLHNPRILSMLIWSTYFQKDMTSLCNKILGTRTVIGIYKITNQKNDKCYIGQSVDISKRWKDHAKCGLGIDTPPGNKLYKEMQEDGIWNFSWELLEECPREQLNEKEKYYIELYQSKDYGYNTVRGNG